MFEEDKLLAAFKMFDKDNSGSISVEEVKMVLGAGKILKNKKVINDLMKGIDVDSKGEIQFDSFKRMMIRFLE